MKNNKKISKARLLAIRHSDFNCIRWYVYNEVS